jgi:hypothetical protein
MDLEEVRWVGVADCCEHGNELSGSVKFCEYLD